MKSNKYIGSVLFYKHVFITIFSLLIIVPLTLSIIFGVKFVKSNQTVLELQTQIEKYVIDALALEDVATNDTNQKQQYDTPTYQALYKELYVEYPTEFIAEDKKTLYLTFDDGPTYVTDTILNVLNEKNLKATFFISAENLDNAKNVDRLKNMSEQGHTIGIHTNSHNYNIIYNSVEEYLEDFYIAWNKVYEATGVKAEIFRFPGGSINAYNAGIYQELIAEMTRRGFVYYDWNATSEDSVQGYNTVQSIISESTRFIGKDKLILLMHDGESKINTAKSLSRVIDIYLENGYTIKPLSKNIKPIAFAYK